MVYSGRPSTGCARCKARRKKCDETRPGCINCRNIGRECPGFPDKIDLMFRHETASVTRRATGKKKPPPSTAKPPESQDFREGVAGLKCVNGSGLGANSGLGEGEAKTSGENEASLIPKSIPSNGRMRVHRTSSAPVEKTPASCFGLAINDMPHSNKGGEHSRGQMFVFWATHQRNLVHSFNEEPKVSAPLSSKAVRVHSESGVPTVEQIRLEQLPQNAIHEASSTKTSLPSQPFTPHSSTPANPPLLAL